MFKRRDKRTTAIDVDHLKLLHQEAYEQLSLMLTITTTAESASGTLRDQLTMLADSHWQSYLDVLHLIAMHDTYFGSAMKRLTLDTPDVDKNNYSFGQNKSLIFNLIDTLKSKHKRLINLIDMRQTPMNDYFNECVGNEQKSIVQIIAILHQIY